MTVWLVVAGPLFAADVQTVAGKKVVGEVTSADSASVAVTANGSTQRLPIADLLVIDFPVPDAPLPAPYTDVELADGSLFHCKAFAVKGDEATLELAGGVTVTIPLPSIATVLRDAHDAKVQKEWAEVLAKRGTLDLIALRTEGKLDALEGTIGAGNAAGDRIEFTLAADGKKRTPPQANLAAIAFVPKADATAVTPVGQLITAGRDRVVAQRFAFADGRWTAVTVGGARVTLPTTALTKIDLRKSRFAYLSDLSEAAAEYSSTEDLIFPHRKDRNQFNGPLRLNGVGYEKGLSLHSRTSLAYDLGGDYREFRAVVGVDDAVLTDSRCQLLIEGDGRELLRVEVGKADAPKPVALDVKGVKLLRVTVSAPVLDLGNQLDLADARVSK